MKTLLIATIFWALIFQDKAKHHCSYYECPYADDMVFRVDSSSCSNNACWKLDSMHFEYQELDYDGLDSLLQIHYPILHDSVPYFNQLEIDRLNLEDWDLQHNQKP